MCWLSGDGEANLLVLGSRLVLLEVLEPALRLCDHGISSLSWKS
jgi:hypothetical protein